VHVEGWMVRRDNRVDVKIGVVAGVQRPSGLVPSQIARLRIYVVARS
jgi:hypothetical protein